MEDFVELECRKEIGKSGWCGTCLKTAKKGQPGYCGKDAVTPEDIIEFDKEMPRPTAWGGWGFCDPLCRQLEYSGYVGTVYKYIETCLLVFIGVTSHS